MSWLLAELGFEIIAEDTDDPVVTARITTPAGDVFVMAEASEAGRVLRLEGLHTHGPGAHSIGAANLRVLADLVMAEMDYDAIEIAGAVRSTGAGKGRRPRVLRFTRRSRPEAGTGG